MLKRRANTPMTSLGTWIACGVFLLVGSAISADVHETEKIAVLFISAHPDDEGIFFGATMAFYSGVLKLPTRVLSMTSGDWNSANLEVREAELRCAVTTYGITNPPLFGQFRDVPSQAMTGNPYTNRIDATWDYWADGILQGDGTDVELGKTRAIRYIAEQIRRYKPEVIVTHDVKGEYGHDNHRATAWAATNAFFLAADLNATATNLAGLSAWQAKKLYLHLYPTNRLFHQHGEVRFAELQGRTPREVANQGLDCHVSQGKPDVSTVYLTGENFDTYHSEWFGLYASAVGLDPMLAEVVVVAGYTVPAGVAAGSFLHGITAYQNTSNEPPTLSEMKLPDAVVGEAYAVDLSSSAGDTDLGWGDALAFWLVNGPGWLSLSPAGLLSGVPVTSRDAYTIRVRVTDRSGLSAEREFSGSVIQRFQNVGSLVAYWAMDDLVVTQFTDVIPAGQHGVGFGGVTLMQIPAPGMTGWSCLFNGSTNGKIDVPFSAELNPPQFTVACWVRPTGGQGAYRSPVTSRRDGVRSGYMLYAGSNDRWQFWVGAGSAWRNVSAGPVQLNQWMHLAGTYDGTNVVFYTNGVLAATAAESAFRPNDISPLRIGAGASETDGQYWFSGMIDDVRVYKIALTAAEIGALLTNKPPAFLAATIQLPPAVQGSLFTQNISSAALDPESQPIAFWMKSGPTWLALTQQGIASGTPGPDDYGTNSFVVAVVDSHGSMAETELRLVVDWQPRLERITTAGDQIEVHGYGVSGQAYILWTAQSLVPEAWMPLSTNVAAADGTLHFTDSTANSSRKFYRMSTK